MIGILAALLMGQTPAVHDFFLRRDPEVKVCAFAAIVPLPALNAREINQLQVALELLPKGSIEYSARTIRQILQGSPIRCKLLPDAVSISFTVPNGAEKDGESLLISLMKSPAFDEDSIGPAIQTLNQRTLTFWQREIDPRPMSLGATTRQELLDTFHKVFTLPSVSIGAISSKNLPTLAGTWADAARDWPAVAEPRLTEEPAPFQFPKVQPTVSTGEFIGAEIRPSGPELAAELVALYALGSGKDCSLFRISREKHAWSYEQESLLWPTMTGWEPRLFIAMAPDSENGKRLDQLATELRADVDTWNSDTLASALGMAEANLLREVPFGPLTWNGEPLNQDPEQRIAFDLYWAEKTGTHFSRGDLLESLQKIDLTTLKATAVSILASFKIHYLQAES